MINYIKSLFCKHVYKGDPIIKSIVINGRDVGKETYVLCSKCKHKLTI